MNEFTKKISLKVDFDNEDINKAKKTLDTLTDLNLFDKESSKQLQKDLEEQYKKEQTILKLQKDIEVLKKVNTKESNEARKALERQLKLEGVPSEKDLMLKDFATGALTSIATTFLKKLKGIFDDSLKELDNMLSYSRLSNQQTRDLRLQYGFSASEAYGYSTAMEMLGFSSMEDLMYANEHELQLFRETFDKYSEKYDRLYDSGFFETMLEYQVEMEEFKLDLQHELIAFFMDNKEIIKSGLLAIIDLSKEVISFIGWIQSFYLDESRTTAQRTRDTTEILRQYTSNQTNFSQTNYFEGAITDSISLANTGKSVYTATKLAIDAM